jgi:hypothetical protein
MALLSILALVYAVEGMLRIKHRNYIPYKCTSTIIYAR